MFSCIHLGMISLERYTYIAYPFFYQQRCTKMFTLVIVICLWILAFIFCTLPLVFPSVYHKINRCFLRALSPAYLIYTGCFLTEIVLVITFCAYAKIALLSYRQRRAIEAFQCAIQTTRGNEDQQSRNGIKSNKIKTSYKKSVKFFFVMYGAFFFFIFPTLKCIIIEYYFGMNQILFNILLLLPFCNCGVNFFINFYMNSYFRQAVCVIFSDFRKKICHFKVSDYGQN